MSTKSENFNFLKSLFMASVSFISEHLSYFSLAIFQPYRDLEAGDNQSLLSTQKDFLPH